MPLTINSIHDFLNHEHSVCNSKIEKHVHEKDIDCKLHLIKLSDANLASNEIVLHDISNYSKNNTSNYSFVKNHNQLSFSLRGPPLCVLE